MNFEYANATDEQLMDWKIAACTAQREEAEWAQDSAQVLWAERGGYAAGLARPLSA